MHRSEHGKIELLMKAFESLFPVSPNHSSHQEIIEIKLEIQSKLKELVFLINPLSKSSSPNYANKKLLDQEKLNIFLAQLKRRFELNLARHPNIQWEKVEMKLRKNPNLTRSLFQMEETGGEPDVIEHNPQNNTYTFYDCSEESPMGRRNLCYDDISQFEVEQTSVHRFSSNASQMALEMGISILTWPEYLKLQDLGKFDLNSRSWIKSENNTYVNIKIGTEAHRLHKGVEAISTDKRHHSIKRGFRGKLEV